jgi:hypothetical protein
VVGARPGWRAQVDRFVHDPTSVVTAAVLLAGIAVRVWVLRGPLGVMDLDEATAGLQAQSLAHVGTFFPRQAYGGTAETFLVWLSQTVFGHRPLAVKLVPMLLHLVAAALAWRAGRRFLEGRIPALLAGGVVWIGSAAGVWESTKERGFYGAILLVAAAAIFLSLRLVDEASKWDPWLLGVVVGIGVWTSPLTVLVIAPPVLWAVARKPKVIRQAPKALAAAVVASAPWWVWNLRNGWKSLDAPPNFGTTWFGRFRDLLDRLPVITGFETPFDTSRRLLPTAVVVLLVLAAVVVASFRTRTRAPGLLATLVLGYAVLYPFNGLAAYAGPDPRYLYGLLPALALVVGGLVPASLDEGRRRWAYPALAAAVLVLTMWGLVGLRAVGERPEPDQFVASPRIDRVVDLLQERGVHEAITDVAGSQLTFLSDRVIVASSYAVPRFSEDEEEGESASHSTFVLRKGKSDAATRLRAYLAAEHIGYEHRSVGTYDVFFIDGRVRPADIPLTSFAGVVRN